MFFVFRRRRPPSSTRPVTLFPYPTLFRSHGDLARGTGHFRLSLEQGQALMRGLRGRHSGLMQPTYILDIPGGHGKVPVGPVYAEPRSDGADWDLTAPWGCSHLYDDPRSEQRRLGQKAVIPGRYRG